MLASTKQIIANSPNTVLAVPGEQETQVEVDTKIDSSTDGLTNQSNKGALSPMNLQMNLIQEFKSPEARDESLTRDELKRDVRKNITSTLENEKSNILRRVKAVTNSVLGAKVSDNSRKIAKSGRKVKPTTQEHINEDENDSLDNEDLEKCMAKLVPVGDEVKKNLSTRCEQNPSEVAELNQHSPIRIGAVQIESIPAMDERALKLRPNSPTDVKEMKRLQKPEFNIKLMSRTHKVLILILTKTVWILIIIISDL